MILLRFLDIKSLSDIPKRDFKEQWFRLWCQTRISLSLRPQSYSVYHSLDMSSLMSSAPITYLSASSKLVGIWDGILVGFSRSYTASRLSYWTKIRNYQVSPQGASLVRSSRVVNLGGSDPFWYLTMYFGAR